MKSLSLKNLKEIIDNNEKLDLNKINKSILRMRNEYEQMLLEQNDEFWIKFIVSAKYFIMDDTKKHYKKNDKIFVKFLELLLSKNITKVFDFMNDLHILNRESALYSRKVKVDLFVIGQISQHDLDSTLTGMHAGFLTYLFLTIYKYWCKAKNGNDIEWTVPKSWYDREDDDIIMISHLERYLKNNFSSDILKQYFINDKYKDILWIHKTEDELNEIIADKDDNESTSSLIHLIGDRFVIEVTEEYFKFEPPYEINFKSILAKIPHHNNLMITENRKYPPDFIRTTFPWLSNTTNKKKISRENSKEIGFFERLRDVSIIDVRKWNLLESSLPPYLNEMYHSIQLNNLFKSEEQENNIVITGTWFATWCESFGIEYLKNVHSMFVNEINQEKLINDSDIIVQHISKLISEVSSFNLKTSSLKSFLLSKLILVQLPYNIVLFHQWLVAALYQVLNFEYESIEFKHWPMSKYVENIINNLFIIIRHVKERIILGFYIFSLQIINYPNRNIIKPTIIHDEIIFPTLGILEALVSNEIHDMLISLKIMCWKSIDKKLGYHYSNPETFTPENCFSDKFNSCFYSIDYWLLSTENDSSCFDNTCKVENVYTSITKLRKPFKIFSLDGNNDSVNNYNCLLFNNMQEKLAFNTTNRNYNYEFLEKQFATNALNLIQQYVIHHMTGFNMKDIKKLISTDIIKEEIKNFFNETTRDIKSQYFCACINLLKHTKCLLLGCENENSVLARTIRIQLEIIEKDVIVRLICILCNIFNIPHPVLSFINLKKHKEIDLNDIESKIKNWLTCEKQNICDEIYEKLDKKFYKGVKIDSTFIYKMKMDKNITWKIISNVQERIHKIIYHAVILYLKSGVIFPYINSIHYILPSILVSTISKLDNAIEKLLEDSDCICIPSDMIEIGLVIQSLKLLEYYETEFINWLNEKPINNLILSLNSLCPKNIQEIVELLYISDYYHLEHKVYLTAFYASSDMPIAFLLSASGYLGINYILKSWPKTVLTSSSSNINEIILTSLGSWVKSFCKIQFELLNALIVRHNIILPGNSSGIEKLRDEFTRDKVCQILELLFHIQLLYVDNYEKYDIYNIKPKLRENKLKESRLLWRSHFYKIINAKKQDTELIKFLRNGIEALLIEADQIKELIVLLKQFRSSYGPFKDVKYINLLQLDKMPQVNKTIKYFFNEEFPLFDKFMEQKQIEINASFVSTGCRTGYFQSIDEAFYYATKAENSKKPKKIKKGSLKPSKLITKSCINCNKKHSKDVTLYQCKQCSEQPNFQNIHYYCSYKCEKAKKSTHSIEHLEFDLELK